MNQIKLFFAYNAEYFNSKDLAKRTILGKILKDIANDITGNCKCDGYQKSFSNIIYDFFDKKT